MVPPRQEVKLLLLLLLEEARNGGSFFLLRQRIVTPLRSEKHRRVCVQLHFGYLQASSLNLCHGRGNGFLCGVLYMLRNPALEMPLPFLPRSHVPFGNAVRETPFRVTLNVMASRRETEFREVGSQTERGDESEINEIDVRRKRLIE